MQPELIVETMLRIGREVWAGLSEDERKNTMHDSPFAQRMEARALEAVPFKSIRSDRDAFRLMESVGDFYAEDRGEDSLPAITVDCARDAFHRRAMLSASTGPYDSVTRISALIEDIRDGLINGDEEEVLEALRLIRKDMMAAIPLPSAQAAE